MVPDSAIAIIGMNGRFPNSPDVDSLWENICKDRDLSSLSQNAAFCDCSTDQAHHVGKGYPLQDPDLFDASFFGISPSEATRMDPQQRILLEASWSLMEEAGYGGARDGEHVGVYVSSAFNGYLHFLLDHDIPERSGDYFEMLAAGDKDYASTRIAYKLGLTGPALTIQSACSSSLVATGLACQSLLDFQCDMAIAGGICLRIPQSDGYHYEPGGALSPDGTCRPFDTQARGTVGGNGAGLVLLKRLEDAIDDGDEIHAVILSHAMNNDGSDKPGFTAPSLSGQKAALSEALEVAEIDPSSIRYIEAHGTGTPLGDPIEFEALHSVYANVLNKSCYLGSIKGHIGHLDTAAGVSGLIKTAKILETGLVPPTRHFSQPNPEIDIEHSPFKIASHLESLPHETQSDEPWRAAVSSFGFGGTNVHMILEEAPARWQKRRCASQSEPEVASSKNLPETAQLIQLSGKTTSALQSRMDALHQDLADQPDLDQAALAQTLRLGRRSMPYRASFVTKSTTDMQSKLEQLAKKTDSVQPTHPNPFIVYLLPGQGSQVPGLVSKSQIDHSAFHETLERCYGLIDDMQGPDLRALLEDPQFDPSQLARTDLTQLAIFAYQQAVAAILQADGITADLLLGHSLGEVSAACIAGVLSLEDGLKMVLARGRLMELQPEGSMLAVICNQETLSHYLSNFDGVIEIAAINSPDRLSLTGSNDAIAKIKLHLENANIPCALLETSHAFHSHMMQPAADDFALQIDHLNFKAAEATWVSNLTGQVMESQEITSNHYWAKQMREPVQFANGCQTVVEQAGDRPVLYVELGPQTSLTSLVKANGTLRGKDKLLPLWSADGNGPSNAGYLDLLGRLWEAGASLSLAKDQEILHPRCHLRGYRFEGQSYWPEAKQRIQSNPHQKSIFVETGGNERKELDRWFYAPQWLDLLQSVGSEKVTRSAWAGKHCLIVNEVEGGVAPSLCQKLSDYGVSAKGIDTKSLASELEAATSPILIFLMGDDRSQSELLNMQAFSTFIELLQKIAGTDIADQQIPLHIIDCSGRSLPSQDLVLGAAKSAALEFPQISLDYIRLDAGNPDSKAAQIVHDPLVMGLEASDDSGLLPVCLYQNGRRKSLGYQSLHLPNTNEDIFQSGKTYLIIGGLCGIGLEYAKLAARCPGVSFLVTSRTSLPAEEKWEAFLSTPQDKTLALRVHTANELRRTARERVHFLACDLLDETSVQDCLDQSLAYFGRLDGIVHSAGIPGGGMITTGLPSEAASNIPVKAAGALTLCGKLNGAELDFLLFNSSLSSIQGALGQADNCAANQIIDGIASRGVAGAGKTISINWDRWRNVGMAVDAEKRHKDLTGEAFHAYLDIEEGLECLARILQSGHSQIAVSTFDLIAESRALRARGLDDLAQALSSGRDEASKGVKRPDLHTPYRGPSDNVEELLAMILAEHFGFESVGIDDSYTDLGGDSLMALSLSKTINETFKTSLPINTLFKAGSVAAIALALRDQEKQPGFTDMVAKARLQIAQMNDEQKQQILTSQTPASPTPSNPGQEIAQ